MVITPTREKLFTLATPGEVAAFAQEEIEALEAGMGELEAHINFIAEQLGLNPDNYQSWSLLTDGISHAIEQRKAQLQATESTLQQYARYGNEVAMRRDIQLIGGEPINYANSIGPEGNRFCQAHGKWPCRECGTRHYESCECCVCGRLPPRGK